MKRLTLYTVRYEQMLNGFVEAHAESVVVRQAARRGNDYALCFAWAGDAASLAEPLMALLGEAAVQENPVYRCSPKMRLLARELRHTPLYENELEGLKRYLRTSGHLHIEGYLLFRMGRYCEKLDMMSYGLIKKLNLFAKED
jgi:hypothetical protein